MSKTVLITGGTGFVGKRLGMVLSNEYRVILGGRNNTQNKSAQEISGCEVVPMDVTKIESVRDIVVSARPEIIIHAAATKFVDQAERHPMECIDVNVTGSQNVARVAMERGVDVVVGVSTDKASPPVRNTYGLSKAMMERMFCGSNGKTNTKFVCVRFGNVTWSTGSVFPIWKSMHDKMRVIGVTGPEMRRFFFTANQAVQLVITAMNNADRFQGEVLSREMKAATLADISRMWIAHHGGRWQKIARRPGERTDEFLVGEAEVPHTSELVIEGIRYYLMSFNENAAEPVSQAVSSANGDKLSDEEILQIISDPSGEELFTADTYDQLCAASIGAHRRR